jgi:hypothetical protein
MILKLIQEQVFKETHNKILMIILTNQGILIKKF